MAEFYSARGWEIPPLPWTNLSPPFSLHPNLAELYRRKVAELQRAVQDPSLRDEALTILRSLIDHVVITPADSGFEVDFVGG